jgi:hypothetical protein
MKKKITKTMLENFDKAIREWKYNDGDCGDPAEMKKVYAKDRRQLNRVYNYIVEGDYKLAGMLAQNLDTIIRYQIPNDIWIRL